MNKSRMEAFSDGVLAVIITVMVLEMKSPRGATLTALRPVIPVFLTYILSFVYLGIYWNNHHHLLHATQRVNGTTLWANLHLLFWLSLIPFTTAWMGENHFESLPVAVYGVVLLLAGVAYFILTNALINLHGQGSTLATSIGRDRKGRISIAIYALAIPLAFAEPWIAGACYVVVAITWLIPDRRIERKLAQNAGTPPMSPRERSTRDTVLRFSARTTHTRLSQMSCEFQHQQIRSSITCRRVRMLKCCDQ